MLLNYAHHTNLRLFKVIEVVPHHPSIIDLFEKIHDFLSITKKMKFFEIHWGSKSKLTSNIVNVAKLCTK